MRKVIFAVLTLLTIKASAQNCACIQVASTDNIATIKAEQFSFTKDSALVEKKDGKYKVLFCYRNSFEAAMKTDLFKGYNPVIVDRKREDIETMTKLSNNI